MTSPCPCNPLGVDNRVCVCVITNIPPAPVQEKKHSHYFKDVSHLTEVDVYRILDLFGVTDQAIGHAAKKLLVAGGRGHKDIRKDIQDAIDTLERWKKMREEDLKRNY